MRVHHVRNLSRYVLKLRVDADAILQQFYPGEYGGLALAEIIYGDVNPSGVCPFVVIYTRIG